MFKRWESFLLWSTPSSYWIEPTTEKSHILNVSRLGDGRVQVQEYSKQTVPSSATRRTIHGLLGIVDLPLGPVMIVVTRKQKVGDIAGQVIWRVENADVLSLGRRTPASSAELDGHVKCISLILDVLSTPYFYFSYNGDVSNTQQRLSEQNANTGKARTGEESWRRLDRRFIWNFNILQPIHSSSTADQVYKFTLPIIHGAVFIHRCSINSKPFIWGLISRRSRLRTGTRFFVRGADKQGNVGNFVETEQIVDFKDNVAAYVQTRGSMPFIWKQTPNLKYMPKPKVTGRNDDNKAVMSAHFGEQKAFYGEQVLVNLINQTKYEGELERLFGDLVAAVKVDGVHYEPFDFHRECKSMRYDRLQLLVDKLSQYNFGYYLRTADGKEVFKQTGVFRTNCMDCLDRTNVVQSLLASENLAVALAQVGILSSASVDELKEQSAFQHMYRNAWADHANLIAVQYAGTGALKTDFTRTGRRSHWGKIQDGWNASIRYFKNNFKDGFRTDAVQFFVGDLSSTDIVAQESRRRQPKDETANLVSKLPHAILAFIILLVVTLLMSTRLSLNSVTISVFSTAIIIVFSSMMLSNNKEFVDYPISQLPPPK